MTEATHGCECPECTAQRLFDAVALDCQPKSAEDAVYVSGAWRDRVLALANVAPVATSPVHPRAQSSGELGQPTGPERAGDVSTSAAPEAKPWSPGPLEALRVLCSPASISVHVQGLLPRRTMIVSADLADDFKRAFPMPEPS